MLDLLKVVYLTTIFKLKSNSEITLNFSKVFCPHYTTYYSVMNTETIEISKENIITGLIYKDEFSNADILTIVNPVKLDKIIFQGSDPKSINPSAIHIFEYANSKQYYEIFKKNQELFNNPAICKIILDSTTFHKILAHLEKNPMNLVVKIHKIEPYWMQLSLLFFLVILSCSIFYFGSILVKKLSKLDPIFSDFHISFSNLARFENLVDKSMTQCTICFEDFNPEDEVRILGCFHYFHPTCIDRWLIGHSKKCPCCRHNIEVNEKL